MTHGEQRSQPYHLFASKADVGVCCATHLHKPVPRFLNGGEWEYRGLVSDAASTPRDFNADAAQAAASRNGYYLFVMLRS